jgi:hypothetical protein
MNLSNSLCLEWWSLWTSFKLIKLIE